jgi:hypothetical protein
MEAVTKFTLDVSSEEAAELRAAVKTKLSELIGNDTDDVLVVVLPSPCLPLWFCSKVESSKGWMLF